MTTERVILTSITTSLTIAHVLRGKVGVTGKDKGPDVGRVEPRYWDGLWDARCSVEK